jgi:hypothetical protein
MLLNEYQKVRRGEIEQKQRLAKQDSEIYALEEQILVQAQELKNAQRELADLNGLKSELHAALTKLQHEALVAKRRETEWTPGAGMIPYGPRVQCSTGLKP